MEASEVVGVALISGLGPAPASAELDSLRESTWKRLGGDARSRYEAFGDACHFPIEEPHYHLNMIGVLPEKHGSGCGRELINAVHDISDRDPLSAGVSLTTEVVSNVTLYEHFGYRMIGNRAFGDGSTTFGFFRRSRAGEGT